MAIILKNQTASAIELDIGETVPASGERDVTHYTITDLRQDESLQAALVAVDIIMNDGTNDIDFSEVFTDSPIPVAGGGGGELTFQMSFVHKGRHESRWLDIATDGPASDECIGVMPFNTELKAITFSTKKENAEIEISIYATPEGGGTSPRTIPLVWQLVNKRMAHKSNFASPIAFSAGDKIGVYNKNINGSTQENEKTTVTLYFEATDSVTAEGSETWSGKYSTGTG